MTQKIDNLPPGAPRASYGTERADKAGLDRQSPVTEAAAPGGTRTDAGDTHVSVSAPVSREAPFDTARIQSLRAAIADGSYRVDPMEIAKRLAALEREIKG